ncbi:MAG: hypothetical protein ACR2NM_09340 [Bythopirellula sp.]
MRRLTLCYAALAFTCVAAWSTLPALAQPLSSTQPATPLWEVHLNLQKAFASPLGQQIMKMVEKKDPAQIEKLGKFAEAIGLDPRTDIGEVVVFGDGFDETDAIVIANIGQSTGNLEGWILAAPGYRSEDLDNNTLLHSMNVEEKDARAWFALPKHAPSGSYVLIGSLDRDRTTGLARQVLSGSASPIPNPLEGNSILKFFVNDLSSVPMDIDDNDPGAAIVKIVEQIGFDIASDSDNLNMALELSASSAGKARQVSQLLLGLKALVQLAPQEDADAQKISELLESLTVEHTEGESNVRASLSTPYRLIEELIAELQ